MAFESTVPYRPSTLIITPAADTSSRLSVTRTGTSDIQEHSSAQKQLTETIIRRGDTDTFADADKLREQKSASTGIGFKSQYAVDAYQSLAVESKRDEIKLFMGVDTYA